MDDTVIRSIAYKLSPSDKKPTGIIKAAPRIPAEIKISHSKDCNRFQWRWKQTMHAQVRRYFKWKRRTDYINLNKNAYTKEKVSDWVIVVYDLVIIVYAKWVNVQLYYDDNKLHSTEWWCQLCTRS